MRRGIVIGACVALAACSATPVRVESGPGRAATAAPEGLEAAAASITAAGMREHIAFLASDELRGRDTPSPGLEAAARYIADAFASRGLAPAGDGDSYLQRWTYETFEMDPAEVVLELETADGNVTGLAYGTDFFAVPTREEEATGEPVFLGDLASLETGFPVEAAGRIGFVGLPLEGNFVPVLRAIDDAAVAGLVGLVMVFPPELPAPVIGQIASQLETGVMAPRPIPAYGVSYEAASRLLAAGGLKLDELLASRDTTRTPELGAGLTVRLAESGERSSSEPPNVVAVLRGSDPELRDTYVLFSAHFDHVGVGSPDATGDSIYNGADDDASGTAVLLEVAGAFAALPRPPRRSVLFLAVSGEEKGLLGSGAFAENPSVPLDRIVADINVDMIGRNAPDTVIGVGQEYTSLGPLAAALGRQRADVSLTLAPEPDPSEQAFFRSDHVSFLRHDIPALFLTTWLHDEYHQPGDEVDLIDVDKAARVARLVFYLGAAIAEDPDPPTWNPGSLEEVREALGTAR